MTYIATSILPSDAISSKGYPWYHENIQHQKTLLITAGDSWTWGDSLGGIDHDKNIMDCPSRVKSIYGQLLADQLNADFINVAFCGSANIEIHDNLINVLNNITIEYDQIYVVWTLTENGREAYRDPIWSPDSANSLDNFLSEYERRMFHSIQTNFIDAHPKIKFLIARNFTYTFAENKDILGDVLVENTWVDCLAEQQDILPYPENLRFLSTQAIVPLQKQLKKINLYKKFKFEFLENFADAELAMDWLDASELNYKKATKHPTEQGHRIWSDYLFMIINHSKI